MHRLIGELAKLPGIGPRTAERLASHLLLAPDEEALGLAAAIRDLKESLVICRECAAPSQSDPCPICADPERDPARICVVEEVRDVHALEAAAVHSGRFHVLGGRVAPMEGVRERDVAITGLVARVKRLLDGGEPQVEIILATNPNLEGEGTALRISSRLNEIGAGARILVSRIATGMPTGSAIEYVHQEVLRDAFERRRLLVADKS